MDDTYGEALKALQRAVAEEDPLWEELNRLGRIAPRLSKLR